MSIARIQGENFRQFERFELEPAPRLNLITGTNAAGKTTLLEAIHCLGRGRSFRGNGAEELLGPRADFWRLEADAQRLAWNRDGLRIVCDAGREGTVLDLAQALPLQVLEPGAHRLVEDGPAHRRRYLDWGVFHVEPSFLPAWRRYQRALRQRNQALKSGAADAEVSSWNPELAEAGESLQQIRERTLPRLQQHLHSLMPRLLGDVEWSLDLLRGWSAQHALADSLRAHLARDRRLGQTLEGPHRAELRIRLGEHAAKHRVSRGQQKLLVAALLLAQSALIREATGRAPALLVDDFPAELGASFQARLLEALRASGSQVFLTAIEANDVDLQGSKDALFHVEQGQVSRVALV